jgi:hypothetical protein
MSTPSASRLTPRWSTIASAFAIFLKSRAVILMASDLPNIEILELFRR